MFNSRFFYDFLCNRMKKFAMREKIARKILQNDFSLSHSWVVQGGNQEVVGCLMNLWLLRKRGKWGLN